MNKLSGLKIAKQLRVDLTDVIETLSSPPVLVVILVGTRGDSSAYVSMKEKAAKEIGVDCRIHRIPAENATTESLIELVTGLSNDDAVHGLIVQLPLPDEVDADAVLNAVRPDKDVDGFSPASMGMVAMRGLTPPFAPCTPEGIMSLLDAYKVDIEGKNAVVLGRSNIVGTPIALMLLRRGATVTVCHSKTHDLAEHVGRADILVAAVGRPAMVKGDWIKEGAVVVDVGTNAVDDASKKNGYRLVGDVDYGAAKERASLITPVPGGVGPMTVATLMKHTVIAALRAHKKPIPTGLTLQL